MCPWRVAAAAAVPMRQGCGPCKLGCGVRDGVLPAEPALASEPDAERSSEADAERGVLSAPATGRLVGLAGADDVAVRVLATAAACA
jgi:hypothetical protein